MPTELQDFQCDIRAITKRMKTPFSTETNRRDTLKYITDEYHSIPSSYPYRIRLEEMPDRDSGVSIAGFTETPYMPTQAGQFFVDWVMGYVYFHPDDANSVVNPIYFGKGSIVDAEDFNIITSELSHARDVTNGLRPSAQDTPNTSIKIEPGAFYVGNTQINFLGNSNIRLGTNGEYQVSALTQNYYNKILFTIDTTARLKKYEGMQGQTPELATPTNPPAGELPVCLVTIQDDGTGQAGTIKNVQDSDIKDLRPYLQAPGAQSQYLNAYLEGYPTLGEIFFDGFYFKEPVSIDKVTLYARSAPGGGSLQIELMKNSSVTGSVATLAQGMQHQTSSVTPVNFTPADKLGLKVVAVDPQEQAEGITVVIFYS